MVLSGLQDRGAEFSRVVEIGGVFGFWEWPSERGRGWNSRR